LQSEKRKRKVVLVVITTILVSFLIPTNTYAETISPILTEVTQSMGDISSGSVEIKNQKNYDIYVTPKIYKYYAQSEYILDLEPFEEFVKIDTDSILIPANSTKTITFQILGLEALEPGTYYNLIVFTQQLDDKKTEETIIGTTAVTSHLVVLNLTTDPNLETITQDYSIDVQVIDKGIPFLKSPKLKITFFNNSKYTLIPKGEIRVEKHSTNKEPEYIKINLDRNRAYPQDTLEMDFKVNNWYLEDIFFRKTAYIKIQNGIDNGITTNEIEIPGFKNEFMYILITLIVILTLARSIRSDIKPTSKSS